MITFSQLSDTVFDADASAKDLLTLVACLSIFWALLFILLSRLMTPLVYGKQWLIAAGERDYERGAKELYAKFGIDKSKDDYVEYFMHLWPWTCGCIVQHFVGGLFCLPSLLGIGDQATASSLACLAILSEMAWEIQDYATWIYKRFALPDGKATVPTGLLLALTLHHSLTTLLGVPVILNYRSFKTLHWICFNMQTASAISLFIKEYSKMLDITKPRQLRQFQRLTVIVLLVSVWTRGIHWVYLSVSFITLWYQEGAWGFLVIGTFITIIFSIFNWAVCIEPCWKRYVKFRKVSAEYQALPEDAPSEKRRSSTIALEMAAGNVFGQLDFNQELASIFVTNRKVSRRSTMPSSLRARTRRASWNLLRSSAGDISRLLSQMNDVTPSDVMKEE